MNNEQIEQLIQEIVNEVMKRLGLESQSQSEGSSKQKLTIAVDPHREKYTAEHLEILDNYSQNSSWHDCAEKSDLLILNWLDFNRMTYLANLQSTDELTQLILDFLLKKKAVLVLAWEYKLSDIKKNSRFGLWRKYDDILEKLESYGVEFIRSPKHLETRLEKENKVLHKGGIK